MPMVRRERVKCEVPHFFPKNHNNYHFAHPILVIATSHSLIPEPTKDMDLRQFSEITEPWLRTLIQSSERARERAYTPYSNFKVGAALLPSDPEESENLILGCNVENVSYGLTICAERTAIVKGVAEGRKGFKAVAVCAVSGDDSLVPPCGACRQFLCEFNPKMSIYLYNPKTGQVGVTSLEQLLPQGIINL